MGKKKSLVWNSFDEDPENKRFVKCKLCNTKVSRGSLDGKSQSTIGLLKHLKVFHVAKYNELQKQTKELENAKKALKDMEDEKMKTSMLKTKHERQAALDMSLPDFIKSKAKWDFHSAEAQRIHKVIFEEIIMDLQPFTLVDGLGFLRTKKVTVPQFEVASSKYYRSLLEPTFDKVKSKLKLQIMEDNPASIALSLDGWSAYKHGYLGVNLHYMKDWKRMSFHLVCQPFDKSHTAENIRDLVKEHCEE